MSNPQRRITDHGGIQFDPRITMGNLLSIASMIGAVFIAYMNLNTKVAVIETKQDEIASNVAEIKQALIRRGQMPASLPSSDFPSLQKISLTQK